MTFKLLFPTIVALVLSVTIGDQLSAQQLVLQVDRQTGDLSLTGVDANVVDFAGYAIGSNLGTLASGNFTGLQATEADWVFAGTQSANGFQELNSNGNPTAGSIVNDTLSFDLDSGAGAYDPLAGLASLSLGDNVEENDLSLTYYDQIANATLVGAVQFVGEEIFNNIGITVDLNDGKAYIENESPNDLTITGYIIESATGGILNTTMSFNGLGSGFEAPTTPTGDEIGEIDSTGTGQLLASSRAADTLGIDLGVILNDPSVLGEDRDDLSISFILDGIGEVSRTGFVKYIEAEGADGDFNADGLVDASDYVVWADGAAAGGPGIEVYDEWAANFSGIPAPAVASVSASAGSVPEPSALLILAAGCLSCVASSRRR